MCSLNESDILKIRHAYINEYGEPKKRHTEMIGPLFSDQENWSFDNREVSVIHIYGTNISGEHKNKFYITNRHKKSSQENLEQVSNKKKDNNVKSHKTKLQIKDDARKDFKKRCLDITYYPVRIIQKTNDYEYFGYVVDSTGYNDGSFPVILIYSVDSRIPQTTGMINLSAFQGLIELGRRNVTLENGFNATATIIQVGDKICADLAHKILGD